jgi:hypothetical protein
MLLMLNVEQVDVWVDESCAIFLAEKASFDVLTCA